jgi:autotransporter passenger strand-loop-strand repeat protein
MTVHKNTIANSTTVDSGGDMYIYSGGVANTIDVYDYSKVYVYSEGIANNINLYSFDWNMPNESRTAEAHIYGGTVNNINVGWGGFVYVDANGEINNMTISNIGAATIYNGVINIGCVNYSNTLSDKFSLLIQFFAKKLKRHKSFQNSIEIFNSFI